jgi:hypothetical protein
MWEAGPARGSEFEKTKPSVWKCFVFFVCRSGWRMVAFASRRGARVLQNEPIAVAMGLAFISKDVARLALDSPGPRAEVIEITPEMRSRDA